MNGKAELIQKLKAYDPSADEELISRAFDFSEKAHASQKRASGDPYFLHPLQVANILADLKLDAYSIVTALLHDTVEDTLCTLEEIEATFGPEIAKLVDGVTKLSLLELQSEQTKQAENLRKLVLAMSSDIRVLLVKLADRLHNMRTIHFFSSIEKRKRIAHETMEIYVPLSERIGMQRIKDELEDLAFAQLNPEARDSIMSRLRFLHETKENQVDQIISELTQTMKDSNLDAQISGREKTPYSIWKKMQKKNIAFEQLSDIMAFRVLVNTITDCYHALGIIHSTYPVVPGRFKDFISTPKANNYQSIHTTVIGPYSHRIEVQIRTKEMHQVAEFGVAAHWEYKQGKSREGKQYSWLRGLLEILEHTSNPEEFLEHTKLEMFQDQVFCFTPKGDLISLPRGATPIDFAYAVHSEVGDHTVAVKINGRQMPLRTVLHNGDQVEIITSKTQNPSPTWERFVVTGKARAKIRKFIRSQQRQQFCELGRSILHKAFRLENVDYTEKALEQAAKHLKQATIDDLIAAVGEGVIPPKEVVQAAYPDSLTKPTDISDTLLEKPFKPKHPPPSSDTAVSIKGLIAGMAVHYAGCCHPLPGDRIAGIVVTGKGVTIHTYDCDVFQHFEEPERTLDLSWEDSLPQDEKHVGRLKITFLNKPGSLASMSTAISKQAGNISNIKVTHRSVDFWDLLVDVEVKSAEHINMIIASLRSLSIINSVERV
jgi:GTP pyrophosphokinase